MFLFLKSLARCLILPPAGLLILAVVGLLLRRRRPRLGGALLIISLGSLWLCATPVVGDALQRLADRYPPLDLSRPLNAQAIVILGGGGVRIAPEYGGPAAALATLERLNYGAFLAHRTALPVLVSGSREEASAMRATLSRDFGISVRWIEDRSGDTFENARFSARLLHADGIHRIVLVTSSTHEWRAAHEFMGAGLEVVPAPVGVPTRDLRVLRFVPSAEGMMLSYSAVYELIGEPVRKLFAVLHLRRQQPVSGAQAQTNGRPDG
jgi:uncharacterized SAM-binding protein YcdF (DUF218 family)